MKTELKIIVCIFFNLLLRFFQHYVYYVSTYVTMYISTGLYPNLDLQNANKLHYVTLLDHPLYGLDLAPVNFHLFRALKAHLSGRHFPLMKTSDTLQTVMRLTHTRWMNLPQAVTI